MKSLLLCFLLLPFSSFASVNDVSEVCQGHNRCSDQMLQILEGYQKADGLVLLQELEGFSGSCYYLHPSYKADHQHHGGFIFERDLDAVSAAGLFSFFYKENPYKGMAPVRMKALFSDSGSQLRKTEDHGTHRSLVIRAGASELSYYLKAQTDIMYLVAIQKGGSSVTALFCEMSRHF